MSNPDGTKERLIESAGREFADKGFEAARIRTICDRAGANLAAVNYHFGDKEQLYRTVVLEAYQRRGKVVTPDLNGLAPEKKLREFIRFFFEQVVAGEEEGDWQTPLMLREIIHPTAALDAVIDDWIRPRFKLLGSIIREIRPDADERRTAALCFGVVGQCLIYRMTRKVSGRLVGPDRMAALDLEYLVDHVATFTMAGLRGTST